MTNLKVTKKQDITISFQKIQFQKNQRRRGRGELTPSLSPQLKDIVTNLMISAKVSTVRLPKIKVFWHKSYYVTIYVHDVTNKAILSDSNYIAVVVI